MLSPGTPQRVEHRRLALAAGLVGIFVCAVYLPSVGNGFVWDDNELVVNHPALQGFGGVMAALRTDLYRSVSADLPASETYRPAGVASWWANARIGGPSARSLHAGNVLLHAVAAALLVVLLRQRTGALLAAAAAAAWWALHPLQVEVVAWIASRHDQLVALAAIGLLLVNGRSGIGSALGQGGLLLLGLLSKEIAIVLVPVLLVDDWARQRLGWTAWPRYAAMGFAVAAWTVLRRAAGVRSAVPAPAEWATAWLASLATLIERTLAPLPLTVNRPYTSPGIVVVLLGLAALLLLVWIAWRWRDAAAPVALFVLPLALTSAATVGFGFDPERYGYVPLLGLAWLLAIAGARAREALPRLGRLLPPVLAAWALLGGAASFARLPDWRSDRSLFAAALAVNPDDWLAHLELGREALRERRWLDGKQWLERAQALHPSSDQVANALALAHLQLGNGDEALRQARRAAALQPTFPQAWYFLGWALHLTGDHAEEARALHEAVRLSPLHGGARLARAVAWTEVGDPRSEGELESIAASNAAEASAAAAALVELAVRRDEPARASERLDALRTRFPEYPDLGRLEKLVGSNR